MSDLSNCLPVNTKQFFKSGNSKRQSVSQLQYQSWTSRAVVQQVYFETGPLQCLCDVPQHLTFLSTLVTVDLMQIAEHERTVFDVLAFCETFLRMCASYMNDT